MKYSSLLIFIFLTITAFQSSSDIVLKLGNAKCIIRIHKNEKNGIHVICLHGDENTCIQSFFDLPATNSFELYQLSQRGKRLLEFRERNKSYFFDPNRIFSRVGIIRTLKKYNSNYPKSLINKIQIFSSKVLAIVGIIHSSKHIIAIHNNTNKRFSVITFNHFSRAGKIFISPSKDPDDFFIVTRLIDFNFFKKHQENVVLQSKYARDDGSLSVYCQAHHIPYINVEAEYGHVQHQKNMLMLCEKLLRNH